MSPTWDEKVEALKVWKDRNSVALAFGPRAAELFVLYGFEHHCGGLVSLVDDGELTFCPECRQDVPQRRELTDDEAKPLYAVVP